MRIPINPNFLPIQRSRAGNSDRLTSGEVYLDRNERAERFPADFMHALGRRLSQVALNQYPELATLYARVAQWLGVAEGNLFITEGVSGAIKSILETLSRPDGNVVYPDPGFALYPVYASMYGQESRRLAYGADARVTPSQFSEAIDAGTSAVFLPNPNVPLGGYFDPDDVRSLVRLCADRKTVLVVDEVYFPFGGRGALDLIDEYDNILVARSFSKAFGAAGLRFGYLLGNDSLIGQVSKSRSGYEANALTIETVFHFLDNPEVVARHIDSVRAGMALAVKRLRSHGLSIIAEGSGNFFYIDLGSADFAREMVARLKRRGVHIRGNWNAPWDRGVSVSGAGTEIMDAFATAFLEEWSAASS